MIVRDPESLMIHSMSEGVSRTLTGMATRPDLAHAKYVARNRQELPMSIVTGDWRSHPRRRSEAASASAVESNRS